MAAFFSFFASEVWRLSAVIIGKARKRRVRSRFFVSGFLRFIVRSRSLGSVRGLFTASGAHFGVRARSEEDDHNQLGGKVPPEDPASQRVGWRVRQPHRATSLEMGAARRLVRHTPLSTLSGSFSFFFF